MQQVGRSGFAPAVALTDPARLPVPFRRAGWISVTGVQHAWVLHRRLLVRAGALLAVALLASTLVHYRDDLAGALGLASNRAAQGFSQAGLQIENISLTGLALTDESSLIAALGVEEGLSMVAFDARAAQRRLAALPAVASATVQKVYPSDLIVSIVEKEPVARWRVDGVTFLIDAAGEQLAAIDAASGHDLPLAIGDGAADDAMTLIGVMADHPLLADRLIAMSRIADRRWDLIYDNGLRIMLPEAGVGEAMALIEQLDADHTLLSRDLEIIDLRVSGELALRPVDRSDAETTGGTG